MEGLKDWMAKPEEERKAAEADMQTQWNAWMAEHASSVKNTIGLGAAKRVTADGIVDQSNGLMLSSYVEGESAEAVAEMFTTHPHLQIPGAVIEVMEAKQIP